MKKPLAGTKLSTVGVSLVLLTTSVLLNTIGLFPRSSESVAGASTNGKLPFAAGWLPKGFQSTPVMSHLGSVSLGSTPGNAKTVRTSEAINYIQVRGDSTLFVIVVKSDLYPRGYWTALRDAKGYEHSRTRSRLVIYAQSSKSSTVAFLRVHGYQITVAGVDVSEAILVKFCSELEYRH